MKLVALLLSILFLATPSFAMEGNPYAVATDTVSNTAKSPPTATCTIAGVITPATLEVLTNGVYYTMHDATATPSSSHHLADAGTIVEVEYMEKFRYIRKAASDAAVVWTCFDLSRGKTRVNIGG